MKIKKREKVYIVPTLYGFVYGGGAFVCWLSALFYSNNLAYLLCFFLIILFVIGMLQSNGNLKKISLEKIDIDLLPAHSEVSGATVWLKSHNSDGHIRLSIKGYLEDKMEVLSGEIDLLPAKTMYSARVKVNTSERGKKILKKITLFSRYPFGLFYVWRTFHVEKDYLVYPSPAGELSLPPPQSLGAAAQMKESLAGEDFRGHKKYEVGESPKRIDWKAYARERPLLVKEFNDGRSGFLSLNSNEIKLDFERTLSQICQWTFQCEAKQLRYEVIVGQKSLPVGEGRFHRKKVLSLLASSEGPRV